MMNGFGCGFHGGSRLRRALTLVALLGVLFATGGLSCDSIPFATSTFRDASMDQISSGVKNIVNGIIDGIFAVIEEAGQGGGTS